MQPSRASIVFAVLAASRTLAIAQPADVPAVPPTAAPVAAPPVAAAPAPVVAAPAPAPVVAAPAPAPAPVVAAPVAAPPPPPPPVVVAPPPPAPVVVAPPPPVVVAPPPAPAPVVVAPPPAPAPVAVAPSPAPVAVPPPPAPVVAAPPACAINIVRAPDGVRATIDGWIRAEPHCSVALEVRVIPTDHGLYVLARDNHGRSHERVVPDATSAGVLITSWAADDSVVPLPPPPPVAIAPAPPPVAIAPAPPPIAAPPLRVATAAAIESSEPTAIAARPAATSPTHWIGLSGVFELGTTSQLDVNNAAGARLDATLATRGPWTLGLAATYLNGHHHAQYDNYYPYTSYQTWVIDTSAVLHVGFAVGTDRLKVVPSLGAGVLYTRRESGGLMETVSAVGEASVAAVLRIDRRVELIAGPIVTVHSQHDIDYNLHRGTDLTMTGGLRWGW